MRDRKPMEWPSVTKKYLVGNSVLTIQVVEKTL